MKKLLPTRRAHGARTGAVTPSRHHALHPIEGTIIK
jgi:hypothetical protein